MQTIKYRFKSHPGDLFRSEQFEILPDPVKEREQFLIAFLSNYQSDDRIAYLDDLYKYLYGEFESEA